MSFSKRSIPKGTEYTAANDYHLLMTMLPLNYSGYAWNILNALMQIITENQLNTSIYRFILFAYGNATLQLLGKYSDYCKYPSTIDLLLQQLNTLLRKRLSFVYRNAVLELLGKCSDYFKCTSASDRRKPTQYTAQKANIVVYGNATHELRGKCSRNTRAILSVLLQVIVANQLNCSNPNKS